MANTVQKESKVVYLQIGQNYEHLAENKQFDVSEWVEAYPDATIYILFRRPGEDVVAPVQTTLEDGILTWTISNWETGIIGVGFAEIRAIDSTTGLVKKSHVIPCSVEASVTDEDTAPDFPSWIDRMITMNEHLESVYADFNQELADGIASIQDEAAEQKADVVEAIQDKGDAVIASIPMSYTDLIEALAGATYNPNRHYEHDEFVWYDNALWQRVTDSPSIVGPWNENDWTRAALTAHVTEALWQVESMQREIYNSIAPAWDYYDATASYAVGDYVINRERLYRCISPVSGGGDFDYSKWEVVTVAAELQNYVQSSAIAPEYSASTTYKAGQYVWYSGNVYRCKTDISTAEVWTAAHWQLVKIGDELTSLKSAISNTYSVVGTVIQNIENIPIPFTVIDGKYISSTGGTGTSADAAITDYIDISAFSKIRYKLINVIGGGNWGTALYNENYEMIARKRYPYKAEAYSYVDELWETVIPENARYARFTMLADAETYGDYELYAVNEIAEEISETKASIDQKIDALDFVKAETHIGKNLYNPEVATPGFINSAQGTINQTASAIRDYIVSDYIPVTNGEPIIVNRVRSFLAYDADKNPIEESYFLQTKYSYTYTPDQNGYIRCSLFNSVAGSNMICYGTTLGEYEPYKETVVFEDGIHLSDTMKADVRNIVAESAGSGKKLTVIVNNDSFTLISKYGDTTFLKRTLSYGKRNNDTFEFDSAYIVDGNGTQTLIKESTDDITPLRLSANDASRTVGANHGWVAYVLPIGDLTHEDIGSTWTDGTNTYIFASVTDGTRANFIIPASMNGDSYVYNAVAPSANLTHVSGATHTAEIDVSGIASGNLFPSVNNRSHKLYADGVEITEDGTYYCDKFTVWEQYNIMDYADLGTYLQAHVGCATDDPNVPGCIRQTILYTFGETDCLIAHGTEALKAIYYTDCGFLQGIPSSFTGKSLYRYVNGIADGNPGASSALINMTSDDSGYAFAPSMLSNPDVALNRSVDLVKDNGNLAWGFTMGFIPDISYGANSYRKELSQMWSFRSGTRKSYPCTFRYRHADAGFYADILGYRNYLRPGLDITNETQIEVGDALYVIVDAHTQQKNRSVKVPDKYLGKSIQVLEPVNFALSSNIVGANGVVFSTTAAYGCAVLKITQNVTEG